MSKEAGVRSGAGCILRGLYLAVALTGTALGEDVAFPGGHLQLLDPVPLVYAEGPGTSSDRVGDGPLYAAAWSCERPRVTLHVGVHAGHTEVHRSKVPLVRRSVESALGSSPVRLADVGIVELPAGLAYRVECVSRTPEGSLRQVQLIVSGRETFVLTFSAMDERPSDMDAAIDDAVATLRLDREAGLLQDAPPWLCGSCLALVVSAILVSRQIRARIGSRRDPTHDPLGLFRSSESFHSKSSGV